MISVFPSSRTMMILERGPGVDAIPWVVFLVGLETLIGRLVRSCKTHDAGVLDGTYQHTRLVRGVSWFNCLGNRPKTGRGGITTSGGSARSNHTQLNYRSPEVYIGSIRVAVVEGTANATCQGRVDAHSRREIMGMRHQI